MIITCRWDEDIEGYWRTSCDNAFTFTDGGPDENGMMFCCYCGRSLQAEPYIDADVERERASAQQREQENRLAQEIDERRAND